VLILLYEKDGELFLPLIQRPVYEGVHSGQMALPGGKREPSDYDAIATALRETQEEIGILPGQIKVLGTLTPLFIPPSQFWVNVILAYSDELLFFTPDVHEVAAVVEFPLSYLTTKSTVENRAVNMGGAGMNSSVPGYVYQDHFIWGATSMILSELRELIQ
jgi:8-oxo-dGTP pyrophosphatase MutT (NUDIX family)